MFWKKSRCYEIYWNKQEIWWNILRKQITVMIKCFRTNLVVMKYSDTNNKTKLQ